MIRCRPKSVSSIGIFQVEENLVLIRQLHIQRKNDLAHCFHPTRLTPLNTINRNRADSRAASQLGLTHQLRFAQFSNTVLRHSSSSITKLSAIVANTHNDITILSRSGYLTVVSHSYRQLSRSYM